MKRFLPVFVIAALAVYAACDDGGGGGGGGEGDVIVPDNGGGGETTPEPDACTPTCDAAWECGDDGCGGTCGAGCADGVACVDHMCDTTCVKQCDAAWECGEDGCGGSCGAGCPDGVACVDHMCDDVCEPTCDAAWECGDDGCGGTCGAGCADGVDCVDHMCVVCEPTCDAAWECGDDGCGGTCGAGCADGVDCVDHMCFVCEPTCDAAWECGDDGCGGTCGAGCEDGFACVDHMCEVCTPNCDAAWECGDDGCGGTCGAGCEDGFTCDAETHMCLAFAYGPSTFVNTLYLPFAEGDEPCCFDFTGDGEIDNAVANLLGMLGGLLGDVDINAEIQGAIDGGSVAVLFEFLDVADWVNQAALDMNFFLGKDADDDYADNLDPVNGGTFHIDPASLDAEGNPLVTFADMSITNGLLAGGPSQFILDLPIMEGIVIHAVVDGAMIEGNVAATAEDKVTITDGKLGGYVAKETIANALNAYIDSSCDCLGLGGAPLIDLETNACAAGGTPANCTGDAETCGQIYDYCGMALPFIDMVLDVDSDGDGTADSISIGVTFGTIPAMIDGVAEVEE